MQKLRLLEYVVLIGSVGAVTPLEAQHVQAEESGEIVDGAQACALCHSTHKGGGEQGLRLGTGDSGFVGGQTMVLGVTSEISDASRSCLRCHGTPELRGRQGEFGGRQPSGLSNRGFLGPDLTDDHPIGSLEGDPAMLPSLAQPGSLSSDGDVVGQRLVVGNQPGDLRVECTTCHDPH